MADLEERVTAYKDNLLSIAKQIEEVAVAFEGRGYADDYAAASDLRGSVSLYSQIAEDLRKVIADEPLEKFEIQGTL